MRYLTLFAVVSLIVAVAWTNLQPSSSQPVHVPAVVPPEQTTRPGLDPEGDAEGDPDRPPVIVIAGANGPPVLDPVDVVDVVEAPPPAVIEAVGDGAAEEVVMTTEPEAVVPDVVPDPTTVDPPTVVSAQDTAVVTVAPPVDEPTIEPPIPPVQRGRQLVGRIIDTDGGAIPHVQVLLADRSDSLRSQLATADANGIFVANGMQPGQYALAIVPRSVPGHIARPVALGRCRAGSEPPGFGAVCVDMLDTTKVTTVDVVLPFASSVQGSILGVDGEPADGALVRAVSRVPRFEGVNELVRTDARGRFLLRLVPGPYELQIVARDSDREGTLSCSLRLDAGEQSLLVLDVIDFSLPDGLPSISATPTAPVVAGSVGRFQLWPITASAQAPGREYAVSEGLVSVALEGRVMTRWGESVESVAVACFDAAGEEVASGASDATGTYTLVGVPIGRATIRIEERVAADGSSTTLLHRPGPLIVDVPAASSRAVIEDIIVEVDRIFRVAGRVEVDATALAVYQMQLIKRDAVLASLTESRVRRTFFKGLQLTVSRVGERRIDRRPVQVEDDGTFHWSTLLPSGDVLFLLESRTDRQGAIYEGRAVRPVTPAGVTTTEIVIEYPIGDLRRIALECSADDR